ncbi:MAG: hypothetical protein FWD17_07110 [Polyangiaceae bacterium]|nr:hypothetical protein [Polyangiaceae bacterium]
MLEAIRSASLDELLAESHRPARAAPRAEPAPARSQQRPVRAVAAAASGRLPRRSAEDIVEILDSVVALVKRHAEGLRAEQIRSELGMQAKELPRVLKEGLASRKLRSKGQKRATTYYAR